MGINQANHWHLADMLSTGKIKVFLQATEKNRYKCQLTIAKQTNEKVRPQLREKLINDISGIGQRRRTSLHSSIYFLTFTTFSIKEK